MPAAGEPLSAGIFSARLLTARPGWAHTAPRSRAQIGTFLELFPFNTMIDRGLAALLKSLVLCLAVANPAAAATSAQEVPIGAGLRDATLRGLNGPQRRLSLFRGRPLIINVWASWCGPCREEMASLERLAWLTSGHDFAIIGISTDDDVDRALGMLKNTNATISHFIDVDLEMEHMLGASRLPLTVFVDADGRILKRIYGSRQWDSADALHLIDVTFQKQHRSH